MRVLLVIGLFLGSSLGRPREDVSSVRLEPGAEPVEVESDLYPFFVAPWFTHTWTLETDPGKAIRIDCTEVHFISKLIPQETSCGDFMLYLRDGEARTEVCGHKVDYSFTSTTNKLQLEMRTGLLGEGAFTCMAQAV